MLGFSKSGGGLESGMGIQIWTWDLVQERIERDLTDARPEPESLEEMGKAGGFQIRRRVWELAGKSKSILKA